MKSSVFDDDIDDLDSLRSAVDPDDELDEPGLDKDFDADDDLDGGDDADDADDDGLFDLF